MAFVGLMYSLFAPIESEPQYAPVVYKKDAAVVVGKMIGADVTFTRNNQSLYGDDAECESDNSITGGTISINVDDVLEDAECVILGTIKEAEEGSTVPVYDEVGDASPYGGFGYVRVRRKKGKTSYQANWLHKVQLGVANENSATKAGSVTYQTPTLTGPIMAVQNKADKKNHFRVKAVFETAAEAINWINKLGNYTTPTETETTQSGDEAEQTNATEES